MSQCFNQNHSKYSKTRQKYEHHIKTSLCFCQLIFDLNHCRICRRLIFFSCHKFVVFFLSFFFDGSCSAWFDLIFMYTRVFVFRIIFILIKLKRLKKIIQKLNSSSNWFVCIRLVRSHRGDTEEKTKTKIKTQKTYL